MDINSAFEKLFNYFNVSSIRDLSKKINISESTISKWKQRNSISALKKACRELGIYNEIFKDQELKEEINELINLIYTASDKAENENSFINLEKIKEYLENSIAINSIAEKIRDRNKEQGFYDYFFKNGYKERIENFLLLARVLEETNIDISSEDNAKNQLIELIKKYEFSFFKDKVFNQLNDKSKDSLINWIENDILDFEAYIILKNIPLILKHLRENINFLNKFEIRIKD